MIGLFSPNYFQLFSSLKNDKGEFTFNPLFTKNKPFLLNNIRTDALIIKYKDESQEDFFFKYNQFISKKKYFESTIKVSLNFKYFTNVDFYNLLNNNSPITRNTLFFYNLKREDKFIKFKEHLDQDFINFNKDYQIKCYHGFAAINFTVYPILI